MGTLSEVFGSSVFNDSVMRERLPEKTYRNLRRTITEGLPLTPDTAEVVAGAMKDWAIEKGATHYTHWFQPMTGITAEKHESFISPTDDGRVIMEFSGKELIKGEPDASSFPSGGLRATFEARGYTAWDCTSPAFVKEKTLFIPTAFCSYNGEALDKKTPLLRSMEAVSRQALRVLKLLGNTSAKSVITTVGAEQEYFLIDRHMYNRRIDLKYTGRTLFGAPPPKGQELEDHYFGTLSERISAFMHELDMELWKLGVSAKTKHNEVAPSQHELAPIFATANIAADHNQLIMETMRKIARRHGLVCLLHEKPFSGINGSGKHNNWSLSTDDGQNLLDPGNTPHENAQFLVFLCAVIKAVDEYAELLRVSTANPGNDHRLGANEAPPAIISVFLGDQLTDILEQIRNGGAVSCKQGGEIRIGVSTLPSLPKDSTDRNRTSPFAFTGNKFEFRMVPSSDTISKSSYTLNTIVADSLCQIADRLEAAGDRKSEIQKILRAIVEKHSRVIFNGNNYSDDWVKEAEKRGLPNIRNMVDAAPFLVSDKCIKVFEKHGVLSGSELQSRYEVTLEHYIKTVNIEALTSLEMAARYISPAAEKYMIQLSQAVCSVKSTGIKADISQLEQKLVRLSKAAQTLNIKLDLLKEVLEESYSLSNDLHVQAVFYRDRVLTAMNELRKAGDELELLVDHSLWPFPNYGDMLINE